MLCLGKYLSESFETLDAKTTRHYAKDIWNIACHSDDVGPRPLQWISPNEANSAVTRQNQLEFWNQKAKQISS